MTIRSIAFTVLMSAGLMSPAAQAQPRSTAIAPFAYLNAACLIDPSEPDFDTRARQCETQHAAMIQEAEPIIRRYSPASVLRLTRRMDEMFVRQEKEAGLQTRRDEVVTVAYAAHLRCIGKAMLADRYFLKGDGFDLNRVKAACPETRAAIVAARDSDAERRSFKYLRAIETGRWAQSFRTIEFSPSTGIPALLIP
ncbi:hypothetical protein ABS767_07180 [Sphingomonas sp. ST-64]|uniref:DUF1311 domain-containing protein n=1 Tax=Sphingomonas plantiphila TaxID=3163295 RepID=A0ABW8YNH0_9SPHN